MSDSEFIVRLKGLPWTAQEKDIEEFFQDCKILDNPAINNAENGESNSIDEAVNDLTTAIHLVRLGDGRSSGEAFVEFEGDDDLQKAMTMNKKHLGARYVDIYKVKRQEMDYVLGHGSSNPSNGYYNNLGDNKKVPIVKLKGVPYDCSKEEIANFLPSLEMVPNGISIIQDQFGRCNGEVFVHFSLPESVPEALKKHKKLIGHRYIEVFESSCDELIYALNKSQQLKQQFGGNNNNDYYAYNKPQYNSRPFQEGGAYEGRSYRGGGAGSQRGGYQNVPFNYNNSDPYNYRGNNQRGGFYPSNQLAPRFMNGQSSYGGNRMDTKRPFVGGYINRTTMHHSSTGHTIQMRGLPFSVTEEAIRQFFSPLEPLLIHIQRTPNGKATGIAHVDFEDQHDAAEALKKDKQHIDNRYIELYLKSFSNRAGNRKDHGSDDNAEHST